MTPALRVLLYPIFVGGLIGLKFSYWILLAFGPLLVLGIIGAGLWCFYMGMVREMEHDDE